MLLFMCTIYMYISDTMTDCNGSSGKELDIRHYHAYGGIITTKYVAVLILLHIADPYECISDKMTEYSGSSGIEQQVIDIRQYCHGGMNYCV